MKDIILTKDAIEHHVLQEQLQTFLADFVSLKKILVIPPDLTRFHSKAGTIVEIIYKLLAPEVQVDIMPALGTHMPMTESELSHMFGPDIPMDCYLVHDWRNDVVEIGEVPADYVKEVSNGLLSFPIKVEVNKRLLDPSYDLILSVGQVVPHEVVGMANHNKNILVGCGGQDMINKSHFLGAAYGMEKMMGRTDTPVRAIFNYAEEHFFNDDRLRYILTVTSTKEGKTDLNGLFIGRSDQLFVLAAEESRRRNLELLSRPPHKVVVYLEPGEFRTTWLGNKAVYRTRMAIADGGELIILAPGLIRFGEDREIDLLIRKYGYVGSPQVLKLVAEVEELADNLSAAAHLIHGSSEGRFKITYAPEHVSKEEIEQVNFAYLPFQEAVKKYDPDALQDGYNVLADGEEIFYISNPALGLWALESLFQPWS